MKKIKLTYYLFFACLFFASLFFIGCSAKLTTENLVGKWNCQQKVTQEGFIFVLESNDHLKQDGTTNTSGTLKIQNEKEETIVEYLAVVSGVWELRGKDLYQRLEEVQVTNLTNPTFDEIINPQELFAKESEFEIQKFAKNKKVLVEPDTGYTQTCTRIP